MKHRFKISTQKSLLPLLLLEVDLDIRDTLPPSPPPAQSSVITKLDWARGPGWGLELHGAGRDVEHGRVELLPLERRSLGVPALLQHLVNFLLGADVKKKKTEVRSTGRTVPSRGHNGKYHMSIDSGFKDYLLAWSFLTRHYSSSALPWMQDTSTHLRIIGSEALHTEPTAECHSWK